MERAETLQELWNGFNLARVAFLDLQKMAVADACGLSEVGPRACLAGDLHLVPGQFGTSSQVSPAFVLQCDADALLVCLMALHQQSVLSCMHCRVQSMEMK